MTKRMAATLSLLDLMQMYPTKLDIIRDMERIRWGGTLCCTRRGSTDRITEQKKKSGEYWCGCCCRSYGSVAHRHRAITCKKLVA